MYHFFIASSQVQDNKLRIDGEDVNHMKNVLRMKTGEEFMAVDKETGVEYYCIIDEMNSDEILADIAYSRESANELSCDITLFQCLPKADKMEWIIQKAVELGVSKIVPVASKRCVVKLDEKKEAGKIKRWQAIAESAAKQSGRGKIPEICHVQSFKESIDSAKEMDARLFPYELAAKTIADENGNVIHEASPMEQTREILSGIRPGNKVAILIGPEGGFSEEEAAFASESGMQVITLGKRILRTETAGLYVLSVLGYLLEP